MSSRQDNMPPSAKTVFFRILFAILFIIFAFSAILLFTLPLWGL